MRWRTGRRSRLAGLFIYAPRNRLQKSVLAEKAISLGTAGQAPGRRAARCSRSVAIRAGAVIDRRSDCSEGVSSLLISPDYAQAAGGGGGDTFMPYFPIILILVEFYFMLIRRQHKTTTQHPALLSAMRPGEKAPTATDE